MTFLKLLRKFETRDFIFDILVPYHTKFYNSIKKTHRFHSCIYRNSIITFVVKNTTFYIHIRHIKFDFIHVCNDHNFQSASWTNEGLAQTVHLPL